ncbi:MAG: hypothetical protein ACP5MD_17270, partial [Verrucomicrobiia bacterium]
YVCVPICVPSVGAIPLLKRDVPNLCANIPFRESHWIKRMGVFGGGRRCFRANTLRGFGILQAGKFLMERVELLGKFDYSHSKSELG